MCLLKQSKVSLELRISLGMAFHARGSMYPKRFQASSGHPQSRRITVLCEGSYTLIDSKYVKRIGRGYSHLPTQGLCSAPGRGWLRPCLGRWGHSMNISINHYSYAAAACDFEGSEASSCKERFTAGCVVIKDRVVSSL